ncbi:hypothetical protein M407DRAFT_31663 [Tulasnella calospora MUT 4182]|uniref:Uncharacterized protein n=1 Tax=Tulasnella calospora MUT 4182 TaxID=1051891 RepID=A0A0C3Q632_9AGAM|nr:hypothetical protein M407DRAFT_31663 [Tulasnella calospora MUT 4182]
MSHANNMPLDPSTPLIIPTKMSAGPVTAFPTAMIDSGTTSNFINQTFVSENSLPTQRKQFARHPVTIDGHSLGIIDKEGDKAQEEDVDGEKRLRDLDDAGLLTYVRDKMWNPPQPTAPTVPSKL